MALSEYMQSVYAEAWPLVQDAARTNPDTGRAMYTATDVAAVARQLSARAQGAGAFAYRSALSSLYGLARRGYRAADVLTAASLTQTIDASMIGEWPTAAPLTTEAAQPKYMARMQFTFTNQLGEQSTAWMTLSGITQQPITRGDLQTQLIRKATDAYTTPEDEGGKYLRGEQMAQFGAVLQLQLWST